MKILIAEDQRDVALLYKNALDRRNHQVILAENGKMCLDIYHKEFEHMLSESPISSIPFDATILDHKMPRLTEWMLQRKSLL